MAQRSIDVELVEAILKNPGEVVSANDGRVAYQSRVNLAGQNVLVRLIVDNVIEPITVITVIKTTRIDQYWH